MSAPSRDLGRPVRRVALAVAAALLALPSLAGAYALRGSVIASGGMPAAGSTNGTRALRGTVGQTAVGVSGFQFHIQCHGFWCFGGSRVVAVEDPPTSGPGLPTELAFGLPVPNPSRGTTSFELALPHSARVDLHVFDVLGREVDRLEVAAMEAGYHTLRWNAAGATAKGAGLYFVRLLVDGRMVGGRRVIVIR